MTRSSIHIQSDLDLPECSGERVLTGGLTVPPIMTYKFSKNFLEIYKKLEGVPVQTEGRDFIERPNSSEGEESESENPTTSKQSLDCEQFKQSLIKEPTSESELKDNKRAKIVQCKIMGCSVWKSSDKDLYQHIRDDHPDRKHFCDVCPMAFVKVSKLTRHNLTHSKSKPHECKKCDKSFVLKHHLHQHIILVHSRKMSCPIKNCTVRLPKPELYDHIESEHPKDEFKCDVCPMSFTRKQELHAHGKTHSGDKPYSCGECGKKFTTSSSLNKHKKIHSGVRPFKCEVCGKGFTEAGNLRSHIRTHTGEKPFVCSKCGKQFNQASIRRVHEVTCPAKPKQKTEQKTVKKTS
eukprot:sb/3466226/